MIEELKHLGLSNYEAKALNTVLKKSKNLRQLSKESGVPFGKIYSVIKSLKEKDLVKETQTRPKLIYVENASGPISRLLEKKQEEEYRKNDRIRQMATEIDSKKEEPPQFFDLGVNQDDNKRIQLRSFREAKREVLQIINSHHKPKGNRRNKSIWEKEIKEAIKRGVNFKAIYPESIELPPILKNASKKYPKKFQVKRLNTEFTRCDIIDEKKVLIKLVHKDNQNFGGIMFIENEKLAQNLKTIFETFWSEE